MAISPEFKIYDEGKKMIGSAATLSLAVRFMTVCGEHSILKYRGRVVYNGSRDGALTSATWPQRMSAEGLVRDRIKAANIQYFKKCGLSDGEIYKLLG